MGFKEKVFNCYTELLSKTCFNFNLLKYYIFFAISIYLDDDCFNPIHPPEWFPYHDKNPVRVIQATVDGKRFTNKMQLILNWYWDNNIQGIKIENIIDIGTSINVSYMLDGSHKKIQIDLDKKTINNEDIAFEFIKLRDGPAYGMLDGSYKKTINDEDIAFDSIKLRDEPAYGIDLDKKNN